MRRCLAGLFGAFLLLCGVALPAGAAPTRRVATMSVPSSVTGGNSATVSVTLSRRPSSKVTLHIATHDGTAHAGVDYTAVATDITFNANDWSPKSVAVPTVARSGAADVSFTVALTVVTGAYTPTPPTASVVIQNSDLTTQTELVRALRDENFAYVPQHRYVGSRSTLVAIDPGLDWGGRLSYVVFDWIAGDNSAVCLQETSATGRVFAIAEVTAGADAGEYANVGGDCVASVAAVASSAWNTGWNKPSDFDTQSDLIRALVVENAVRSTSGAFTTDANVLKAIGWPLDWGGRLTVVVGDAVTGGDKAVACMSESSPTGFRYNVAQVAAGPNTGEYYNTGGDCSSLSPSTLAGAWSTGWY